MKAWARYCFRLVCMFPLLASSTESLSDTFKYYYPNYPPFQYSQGGKPAGIFPPLLEEAFRRMGHELETINVPWARVMRMMKTGETDIVPAFKTPGREKFMDFSGETFLPQPVAVFVRKDSEITQYDSLEQLSQYRVGIVLKISYGTIADEAIAGGVLPRLEYAADGRQSVMQLVKGRVDLIILNSFGAYHILRDLGVGDGVREIRPAVQTTPTNLGFSKKRGLLALRDTFDRVLVEMKNDGSYDRILSQFNLGERRPLASRARGVE